jgi:paraquat-inducible protein B
VAIEPARLGLAGQEADAGSGRQAWDDLVAEGLRAQLKSANLLLGGLFVDLDFHPAEASAEVAWDGELPRLPTLLSAGDQLDLVLAKLARLPVDQLVNDLGESLATLGETMDATNRLIGRVDGETLTEFNATLVQTRSTLASLDQMLSSTSPLSSEAHRVLRELGAAARSLRIMADYIERHPEALLRGKEGGGR